MPIKPKPLHLPLKISETSWIERTLPYSENKVCTLSSVASLGKFPTKSRFKRHVLNSGGGREMISLCITGYATTLPVLGKVVCQKVTVYAVVTFEACGPLGPDSTSYFTAWPSAKVR